MEAAKKRRAFPSRRKTKQGEAVANGMEVAPPKDPRPAAGHHGAPKKEVAASARPARSVASGRAADLPEEVRRIRAGLPVGEVDELARRTGLGRGDLARAVGLVERTLRNRTERLTPIESDRILRVETVFARAVTALDGLEPARQWLVEAAYGLGGARPIDLLDTEPGTQEVLNLLGAIEHNDYF